MGSRQSFRVYFVGHTGDRLSGVLLRRWDAPLEDPPPAAYGTDEADVLRQLEVMLQEAKLSPEDLQRYLWQERFGVRRATVTVHPQSAVKGQPVIGARRIPLQLSYAHCPLPGGAHRLMLPRFGWWMVVEDLGLADEAIRTAVSGALLGEQPRWLYDFRREGEEYVKEWIPQSFGRGSSALGEPPSLGFDRAEEYPILDAVSDDLLELVERRKLPAPVGEDPHPAEMEALVRAYPPPSLLLVGEPGVGKSTWVRRLAHRLTAWRREGRFEGLPRIFRTSAERIIAGMIYLGMWQQRCFGLIEELSWEGDYLYVDRLSALLRPQPDGASIADLLAGSVISGEISIIAECTPAELSHLGRPHPALVGAMRVVRLQETPAAAMPALLQAYAGRLSGVPEFHPDALRRLVQLLDLLQPHSRFPGKGLRFVDWLAGGGAPRTAGLLRSGDVARLFSAHTGLPVDLIDDDQALTSEALQAKLSCRVVGQARACAAAADLLARFKARLGDPEKPVGTLLFIGPTGVGKTELAKQLCRVLFGDEARLIRLDMSEYLSPHAADRLLETTPGCGSLVERVRQNPMSLVLLDELEKAHPRVFDLLLGVLGEGRLTDDLGRRADFRMCIVVMTSNLGVRQGRPAGFGAAEHDGYLAEVRRFFRPEFLGRVDAVVPFATLGPAEMERIVALELSALGRRTGLRRRQVKVAVSEQARRLLAARGFHPSRGARPLRRVIEEQVVTPVALRLAAHPALRGVTMEIVAPGEGAGAAPASDRLRLELPGEGAEPTSNERGEREA